MLSQIVIASAFAGLAAAAPVTNNFARAAESIITYGPYSEPVFLPVRFVRLPLTPLFATQTPRTSALPTSRARAAGPTEPTSSLPVLPSTLPPPTELSAAAPSTSPRSGTESPSSPRSLMVCDISFHLLLRHVLTTYSASFQSARMSPPATSTSPESPSRSSPPSATATLRPHTP